MYALDLSTPELRGKVVRRCFEDGMIVLPLGARSVRFRPTSSVTTEAIAEGAERLERAIAAVVG
jgi:4-aminobutyrate aminotransferase-like enzyme